MEEKLKNEEVQAESRIKKEFGEVCSELGRTVCSKRDEAMRNFQNVVDLVQLSEEQALQLCMSILGEVNSEEKVGIKYRYDQRNGQEIFVIPSEWLETNFASTEFEKESFENFDEEACRGEENVCNRV